MLIFIHLTIVYYFVKMISRGGFMKGLLFRCDLGNNAPGQPFLHLKSWCVEVGELKYHIHSELGGHHRPHYAGELPSWARPYLRTRVVPCDGSCVKQTEIPDVILNQITKDSCLIMTPASSEAEGRVTDKTRLLTTSLPCN
jgi:hypothetical protein